MYFISSVLLWLLLGLAPSYAVGIEELMGERAENLSGISVGFVDEFIVDVEAGRVLYVVVDAGKHYHTLPVRAIHEVTPRNSLRLDMNLADAAAAIGERANPRLRRAGRLIGHGITLPGGERRGTIHDLHFEPESGLITKVDVATEDGEQSFPARTLLGARFPPATQ